MTLDEIKTEELDVMGHITKRIVDSLGEAADSIEDETGTLAEWNKILSELKDTMAAKEAEKRGEISTAINKETNRPLHPNLEAQNAAVILALRDDDDYKLAKEQTLVLIVEIEKKKARIARLHEKRRDLTAEREMIVGLVQHS